MLPHIKKLAIFAGQGELPVRLVQICAESNIPYTVLIFQGQTELLWAQNHPHAIYPMGAVGKILDYLKSQGTSHIVMAGGVRRPTLSELKLDWTGTRWLSKMGLSFLGDDGLLKSAISLLEREGFQLVQPAALLPEITAEKGGWTSLQPDEESLSDIKRGIDILKALGEQDVGQSVVIQQSIVLGIEAAEGTKELINRCASLRRTGRGPVLVKMAKPHQSNFADLPTIGPETIHQLVEAGFSGLAVESKKTQVLCREELVSLANSREIFVVGF